MAADLYRKIAEKEKVKADLAAEVTKVFKDDDDDDDDDSMSDQESFNKEARDNSWISRQSECRPQPQKLPPRRRARV